MSRKNPPLSQEEKSVLAVLSYSAQFDHPLTVEEITDRLLTTKGLNTVDSSFKKQALKKISATRQVEKALSSLIKKKCCFRQGGLFTLMDRTVAMKKRTAFKLVKTNKEPLIAELVSLVENIPWVLGVVITGSYAANGAEEQDDVDFLIITQENRLWVTRLLLLFQALVRGRRPHLPGGDISYSWDLNFWLDETTLALPSNKQTLYEAYEILQAQWVYERQDIKNRFYKANSWLTDYLFLWKPTKAKKKTKLSSEGNGVIDLLDWLTFYLQLGYRQVRHGRQKASKHMAFFHPSATRKNILKTWKEVYKSAIS